MWCSPRCWHIGKTDVKTQTHIQSDKPESKRINRELYCLAGIPKEACRRQRSSHHWAEAPNGWSIILPGMRGCSRQTVGHIPRHGSRKKHTANSNPTNVLLHQARKFEERCGQKWGFFSGFFIKWYLSKYNDSASHQREKLLLTKADFFLLVNQR